MQTEARFGARWDALVVGARAAGAATAMLLARAGLRVLAVDRGGLGEDTLSTHGLMRPAVLQLHRWGLLPAIEAAGTPPIRSASFHYGDEEVVLPVKPMDGIDALWAPRRTVLDPVLVRAAVAAGAHVEHGVAAVDLLHDASGRVKGAVLARGDGSLVPVEANVVVGADGVRSRVARLTRAPVVRAGLHATASVYGYFTGLPAGAYHVWFRPGVNAGAFPTNDGRTCLYVALPPARFAAEVRGGVAAMFRRVLSEAAPELAEPLRRARLDAKLRPFPGAPGFLRRPWGPGWALVGDAGYFKDPITAHGITDALRDAELLARAIVAGTDAALAAYQLERDELSIGTFEATERLASFAWDLGQAKREQQLLAHHVAREAERLSRLGRAPLRADALDRAPAAAARAG